MIYNQMVVSKSFLNRKGYIYNMTVSNIPEFKLKKEKDHHLPFKLELLETTNGYNPTTPHRHNYYEIFFFEEGGGIHMIDFNEVEIKKGHIHVLSPGQIHYMNRLPKSQGWVLKFTPDFFLSSFVDKDILHRIPFLNNKVSEPLIRPDEKAFKGLMQLVLNIEEEYTDRSNDYEDMIRHYLNLILLKCHRLYDYSLTSKKTSETMLCDAFKTILEQHYLEQNRVSFYCDQLNVSTDKLNQVLKKVTGITPSEIISARLLLEAKRWLLHSQKSIKEVAFLLNFQDNAYFNRWFKKHENCSPGEFRTINQKKYNT
jgi:AraC family transcriptional regulator, transcriptional activator of pobA